MCYCGVDGVIFGNCVRDRNLILHTGVSRQGYHKTEARQQAAFNYKATRLQSEGTLGLDTTRVT